MNAFSQPSLFSTPTLADVLVRLEHVDLEPIRRRDLVSSIKRASAFLGLAIEEIPIDMRQIAEAWAKLDGPALGVTKKSLSTTKSALLAAIEASGLKPVLRPARLPMSETWDALFDRFPKPYRDTLGRFGRYASDQGIEPEAVTTDLLLAFVEDIRRASLVRAPDRVHRRMARSWNEMAKNEPGLPRVDVPNFRKAPERVQMDEIRPELRADIEAWRGFMACADTFAPDARAKALAPNTVTLRLNQIMSALTAYRNAGGDVTSLHSLADLVRLDVVKVILQQLVNQEGGKTTAYLEGVAKTLISIGHEYVRLAGDDLKALKALPRKLPRRDTGMTEKNLLLLAQLNDADLQLALFALPDLLWAKLNLRKPGARTMVAAQVAIAISLLQFAPMRMQNLIELSLSKHVCLRRQHGKRGTILLPASETKGKQDQMYEVPANLADRIRTYAESIVPPVTSKPADRLFVRGDGVPKTQATLFIQIKDALKKELGIRMTPHQFRHLAALIILDADPGAHETVKQLLGHKTLKITVPFYSGVNSLRAGRAHAALIDKLLKKSKDEGEDE